MASSLVFIGLVVCLIRNVSSLARPTPCRVMWNTPSYGRSRVYFTYPNTQSLYQMYVTHNDEDSVPNTDIFVAGYSTGYPSSPQTNTEYYFEYAYNLEPMTNYLAESYCYVNTDAWACGAYIRGRLSSDYSDYVYCGLSNVPAPTRRPTLPPSPTPQPTPKPTYPPSPTPKPTPKPTPRPTAKPTTAAPVTARPTSALAVYIKTHTTSNDLCSDECDDQYFSPVNYDNCGYTDGYFYKWNWRRNPKYLSYTCDWDMWWYLQDMYNYDDLDLQVGYRIINTQTAQEVSFVTGRSVEYNVTMLEGLGWENCEYFVDGRRSLYLMTRLELMTYDECSECQLLTTNEYSLRDDYTTLDIVYFAEGFRGYDEEIGMNDITYIMSNLGSIGCPAPTPTSNPSTRPSQAPTPEPVTTESPTYSWQSPNMSSRVVCKFCFVLCLVVLLYHN
eukprot:166197_1